MRRFAILIILLGVILVSCSPGNQGGVYVTQSPTPDKTGEGDVVSSLLNYNPDLDFGRKQSAAYVWSNQYITIEQHIPDGYDLYQLHETIDGIDDSSERYPTTVPIQIDHTGVGYTFFVHGRAGEAGFTTSEPITFQPECYGFNLWGEFHLWGNRSEYSAGLKIGDNYLEFKTLAGEGLYEIFWVHQFDEYTIIPVTFFTKLANGSATGESYISFHRFEVTELGYCP